MVVLLILFAVGHTVACFLLLRILMFEEEKALHALEEEFEERFSHIEASLRKNSEAARKSTESTRKNSEGGTKT